MHWLQAFVAALLCGISLIVGSWLAPREGLRSARIAAFVLFRVASVVLVLFILIHGLAGIAG